MWHPFAVTCADCKQPTAVISICFNANGEMLVDGKCLHCKTEVQATTSWEEMTRLCFAAEQKKGIRHEKKKGNGKA